MQECACHWKHESIRLGHLKVHVLHESMLLGHLKVRVLGESYSSWHFLRLCGTGLLDKRFLVAFSKGSSRRLSSVLTPENTWTLSKSVFWCLHLLSNFKFTVFLTFSIVNLSIRSRCACKLQQWDWVKHSRRLQLKEFLDSTREQQVLLLE